MKNKLQNITILFFSFIIILFAISCDDSAKAKPDAGVDADVPGDGGEDDVALSGELELMEVKSIAWNSSQVSGVFHAGGFPRWQRDVTVSGDCVLWRFVIHYCEDYCEGVCVDENVCEPYPQLDHAGTLRITGTRPSITVEPGYWGFQGMTGYSNWSDAADIFDDGDEITATFAGSARISGFSVASRGVQPLTVQSLSNDELHLSNDRDTVFEWEPGTGDRVRVILNANNTGGHGSPLEAVIECDTEDTGRLVIPVELVRLFPETYRWEMCAGNDCPLSLAYRYRRGRAQAAGGTFEFRVGSVVNFFIIHSLP